MENKPYDTDKAFFKKFCGHGKNHKVIIGFDENVHKKLFACKTYKNILLSYLHA